MFFFFFFFFAAPGLSSIQDLLVAAQRIQFPDQALNPGPLHWECSLSPWISRELFKWLQQMVCECLKRVQCSLGANMGSVGIASLIMRCPQAPGIRLHSKHLITLSE